MSDSIRQVLWAIIESTYGTCPTTPAFDFVRQTGNSLALAQGVVKNAEIYADRQMRGLKMGQRQVGGKISGVLSYGTYDKFLAGALQSTWAAKNAPYAAGTISATASDNSINDSANGFPSLVAGDKITIAGFTGGSTTANQSDLKVVSATASKIIVSGGVAFIDDAAGETVTVTTLTNRLKAGLTRQSMSLLRNFTDLADGSPNQPWHLFTGCEVETMSLGIMSGDKDTTVEFDILGQNETIANTAPGSSTFGSASTTPTIASFTGTIKEGGSTIAIVTELTIKLANSLAVRPVVGTNLTRLPSVGPSDVTGQLTAFFEDSSLLAKFLAGTATAFDFTLLDSAGNAYRIQIPNLIYTGGGEPDVKGSGPLTQALPWQALFDTTTGSNIVIDRIPA